MGSVWMYNLSNYTAAWSSTKGKRSDKKIPPTQVGLIYLLGLSRPPVRSPCSCPESPEQICTRTCLVFSLPNTHKQLKAIVSRAWPRPSFKSHTNATVTGIRSCKAGLFAPALCSLTTFPSRRALSKKLVVKLESLTIQACRHHFPGGPRGGKPEWLFLPELYTGKGSLLPQVHATLFFFGLIRPWPPVIVLFWAVTVPLCDEGTHMQRLSLQSLVLSYIIYRHDMT